MTHYASYFTCIWRPCLPWCGFEPATSWLPVQHYNNRPSWTQVPHNSDTFNRTCDSNKRSGEEIKLIISLVELDWPSLTLEAKHSDGVRPEAFQDYRPGGGGQCSAPGRSPRGRWGPVRRPPPSEPFPSPPLSSRSLEPFHVSSLPRSLPASWRSWEEPSDIPEEN